MRKYIRLYEDHCKKMDVDGKDIIAKIGDKEVKLKVATTPESQSKGYMHSEGPIDGEGMLFVYDEDQPLSFWMKNVKVPLDIIFFDSNMNLIDHLTMDPDDGSEDLPKYASKEPARFAVELPKGWCEKNLDKENCKLSI